MDSFSQPLRDALYNPRLGLVEAPTSSRNSAPLAPSVAVGRPVAALHRVTYCHYTCNERQKVEVAGVIS
ncbi:hypothetical protein E2C01_087534 [Portunus trituberculatus]|uniref:Uncharacterized protein n=1 Tax=Portunus trituberculatus TaxID=210409 RepID=A0A5B7JCR1_PORTR|nr:hypothetical protein [Portunus trituberculatus]